MGNQVRKRIINGGSDINGRHHYFCSIRQDEGAPKVDFSIVPYGGDTPFYIDVADRGSRLQSAGQFREEIGALVSAYRDQNAAMKNGTPAPPLGWGTLVQLLLLGDYEIQITVMDKEKFLPARKELTDAIGEEAVSNMVFHF